MKEYRIMLSKEVFVNNMQQIFDMQKCVELELNWDGDMIRIKRELCADILSRLSSHASRVGITYVE